MRRLAPRLGRLPALALLGAALLGAAQLAAMPGCGGREPGAIGLSLPLTGPYKEWGEQLRNGIQLAVQNSPEPRPLVLIVDNGGSVRGVTASIEHLVEQGATVIVGPLTTDNALVAGLVARSIGVPCVVPGATGAAVGNGRDNILRLCYSDVDAGRALAAWARRSAGLERVAVVIDLSSSYSVGLAEAFTREFHRQRGQVVDELTYRSGDDERGTLLDRLAALGVQGALVAGYAPDVEVMVRQARDERVADLVLLGGDGWAGAGLRGALAGRVAGAYHTRHFTPESDDPLVKAFVQEYAEKHLEPPSDLAALGYDAGRFVLPAFGPGRTGPQMLARLRAVREVRGVTGEFMLDADGRAMRKAIALVQLHDPTRPAFVTHLEP